MSREPGDRPTPNAEILSKFRVRSIPYREGSELVKYHDWDGRSGYTLSKYGLALELNEAFNKPEFWQELREDVEAAPSGYSFGLFLAYFDRDKDNKGRISYGQGGKYYFLHDPFAYSASERQYFISGRQIDRYLLHQFQPLSSDKELVKLVEDTRSLIKSKLELPHRWDTTQQRNEALASPQFWEEFARDLTSFEGLITFRQFMQHFDPNEPQKTAPSHISPYIFDGKYIDIFRHLGNPVTKKQRDQDEEAAKLPSRQRWGKPFYDVAPPHIKLLLRSRFTDDFGTVTIDDVEQTFGLPADLRTVLETVSLLRTDSQAEITNALAQYLDAMQVIQNMALTTKSVDLILRNAVDHLRATMSPNKEPASVASLARDAQILFAVLRRTEGKEGQAIAAREALFMAFEERYFFPLLKSVLFKATAHFWHAYLLENRTRAVPEDEFTTFFYELIQRESPTVNTQEEHEALAYLQKRIVPGIERHFLEDNAFAPQINHFPDYDRDGNPQALFLHQIDEIRTFSELGGGISGDETGSGKTLVVVFTGLHLLDRMEPAIGRPRRMLVVGTKSVIDNWENEIGLHLDTEEIDVINLTYTTQRRREGRNFSLGRRLKMFEETLASGVKPLQIAMVNYDVFRRPDFQALLERIPFDNLAIDETHNVKASIFAAIEGLTLEEAKKKGLAQRVAGLYNYITSHPDMPILLATGTPFVKRLAEPLIMGHLVASAKFPKERIETLRRDPVATHRAVSEVMVRFRKAEIADLPAKYTHAIPIDLQDLPQDEQSAFVALAADIVGTWKEPSARFYELLNLEAQAKFPWLIDTVRGIVADGRKVDILTPFVHGKGRHTKDISTAAIAQQLHKAGIPGVGILDGTLSDVQRQYVQESFRGRGGIQVLVGSYDVAGQSITLCSRVNRATHVIPFVLPDTIARYIHGVDRIHRFGQPEDVSILLPFVTGDLIGRASGAYDEKIARRLQQELGIFEGVIDGRFFTESKSFYQEIARSPEARVRRIYGEPGRTIARISEDRSDGEAFREQFLRSLPRPQREARKRKPKPRSMADLKTKEEPRKTTWAERSPTQPRVRETVVFQTQPEPEISRVFAPIQQGITLEPGIEVRNQAGEIGVIHGERQMDGVVYVWVKFGKLDMYIPKDKAHLRLQLALPDENPDL